MDPHRHPSFQNDAASKPTRMDDNEWYQENQFYPGRVEHYNLPERFSVINENSYENSSCNADSTGTNAATLHSSNLDDEYAEKVFLRPKARDVRSRRSSIRCSRQTQRFRELNAALNPGFFCRNQQLRDSRRKTAEMLKLRHDKARKLSTSGKKNINEIRFDQPLLEDEILKKVHFASETDPQLLHSEWKKKGLSSKPFADETTIPKKTAKQPMSATMPSKLSTKTRQVADVKAAETVLLNRTNQPVLVAQKSFHTSYNPSELPSSRRQEFKEAQQNPKAVVKTRPTSSFFGAGKPKEAKSLLLLSSNGNQNVRHRHYAIKNRRDAAQKVQDCGACVGSTNIGTTHFSRNSTGLERLNPAKKPSRTVMEAVPSSSTPGLSPGFLFKAPDVKNLGQILRSEVLTKKFLVFLRRQQCAESLEFYLAVQDYKKAADDKRTDRAMEIFLEFVGTVEQDIGVNITGKNRRAIAKLVRTPTLDLFDMAVTEVLTMLGHDKAMQFARSLKEGEVFGVDDQCEDKSEPYCMLWTLDGRKMVLLDDPALSVSGFAEIAAMEMLRSKVCKPGRSDDPKDYFLIDDGAAYDVESMYTQACVVPEPTRQAQDELCGRSVRLVEAGRLVAHIIEDQSARTFIMRARLQLPVRCAMFAFETLHSFPNPEITISGEPLVGEITIGEVLGKVIVIRDRKQGGSIEKLLSKLEAVRLRATGLMNKRLRYVLHRDVGLYEIKPLSQDQKPTFLQRITGH